ncbi:Retrovirus-related Pol polyprotein from transposon [Dictyocoela muelleri]|nr:Retrovirus-related Pol polyprotein from transposon [Dictyocoela muelleri]
MRLENDELKILDRGVYKIFIGQWEREKIGNIIYNEHIPSHICANKLFDKISKEYIGITRKNIREYVRKCEACNMASSFKNKGKLTYISTKKIHERLFMDIIDLRKFSDKNDGYKYILTIIDSYSKFAFCFSLYNKDGKTIAEK